MQSAVGIFIEIVLAVVGAVFFGSAVVALGALGLGCVLFGSCWTFLGWRRRRAQRARK